MSFTISLYAIAIKVNLNFHLDLATSSSQEKRKKTGEFTQQRGNTSYERAVASKTTFTLVSLPFSLPLSWNTWTAACSPQPWKEKRFFPPPSSSSYLFPSLFFSLTLASSSFASLLHTSFHHTFCLTNKIHVPRQKEISDGGSSSSSTSSLFAGPTHTRTLGLDVFNGKYNSYIYVYGIKDNRLEEKWCACLTHRLEECLDFFLCVCVFFFFFSPLLEIAAGFFPSSYF